MKASMHSGRKGSATHNDRRFLQGKDKVEQKEIAPHIDPDKTGQNRLWVTGKKGWHRPGAVSIEDAEKAFYKKRYGAAQAAKNSRYEAQRHPERRKSTDDLYTGKQTRPEEVILQIGSKGEPVSEETFRACLHAYIDELTKWNKEHGGHMKWLSVSIHVDETSPHAHIRRVWEYDSKDGPALGQDKALQAAGVPLPDPSKPKGRYNNRKITFDRMMREKWLDICEAHGIEVDREPVPGMRHKDKADYIRDQIEKELAEAKEERDYMWQEADEAHKSMLRAQDERAEVVEALQKAQDELRTLSEDIEKALGRIDVLKASERILTAAQAAEIPETATTPLWGLLGRDKVLVPKVSLEKLAQRARIAEKATEEAIEATEGRRRIERQAKEQARTLIEQAQAQAKQITDRAQKEARQITDQRLEERRELEAYRRLEKHHPEEIENLRAQDEFRRRSKRKGRDEEERDR